jgi:hypothetical protein
VRIDLVTIFPDMVERPLGDGIVQRAREAHLVDIRVHDLRTFTDDRHRTVDDAPFGGGPGMVMKAEPFFRAFETLWPEGRGEKGAVVLLSPRGRRFDQKAARRLSALDRLMLLCGRYEGIDERVAESLATEELSRGRGLGGDRFLRYRPPGLAALHATGVGPRPRGPRGPALRRPRPDPSLASTGGAAGDPGAAARPAGLGLPECRGRDAAARNRNRTRRRWSRQAGQNDGRTSQIERN